MSAPPQLPPSLDQRIASALSSDLTSGDLAALIAEAEAAASAADNAAQQERERALDPTTVVDTAKASAAIQASELASARLRAAIPRLQERQRQAAAAEYERDWRSQYEKAKADRDKLSAEFAQSYPDLVFRLADLLGRMAALDETVSKVNRTRPTGVLSTHYGPCRQL
jgi:hypothetical protein